MNLNATKDGRKAILRLGGAGKDHGRILLTRITTKMYPAPIDKGNLIEEVIYSRQDSQNSLALLLLDCLQLTAVYCNRRGCKYYT